MARDDAPEEGPTPRPYDVQDRAHYDRTRQVFRHSALHRSGYYDAKVGTELRHSVWQRRVREVVLSMLARTLHDPARMTVLDVGCGRGDFAVQVARRFPNVKAIWGTDVVPETLALARAADHSPAQVRFRTGDILEMPFDDKSIDVTLCINVLHHIHAADLPRALAELARVTTRSLILEIKNRRHVYYRHRRFRYADPVGRIDIFPTSPAEVSDILARHGFRLTTAAGIFPMRWLSPLLVLRYDTGR